MDKAVYHTKSEKFHKSKRKKFKSKETIASCEEENDAIQNLKLPEHSSKQDSVNIIKDKYNVPVSLHMSDENSDAMGLFLQLEDEDQTFESMFNNIFEQNYSKSFQSFLSKKPLCSNIKERKFFKRNNVESLKSVKTILPTKTTLEAEDVSKVFKIISKPSYLNKSPDLTSSSKPILKTYCNPRKLTKNCDIIETFGLPDNSIIPGETKEMCKNSVLDTKFIEANEVTLFNTYNDENPWMLSNFDEPQIFNPNEEFRIKVHPQIMTNCSSNDFDYLDSHLTSTPNTKQLRKLQNISNQELLQKVENDHVVNEIDKCEKSLRTSLLRIENSESIEVSKEAPIPIFNTNFPRRKQNLVFNDAKKKLRSYSRCKNNTLPLQSQTEGKMSRSKSCEILSEKPHSVSPLNKTSPVEHNMCCLSLKQNIQDQSFSKETLASTISLINNEIKLSSSSIDTPVKNPYRVSILRSNEKPKKSVCKSNNYKIKEEKNNLSYNSDTPKKILRSSVQLLNLSDQNRICEDKEVETIDQIRLKAEMTDLKNDSKKENSEDMITNGEVSILKKQNELKINSSELQILLTPFNMSLLENNETCNNQPDLNTYINTACVHLVNGSNSSITTNLNMMCERSGKNKVFNCNSKILKSERCQKDGEIDVDSVVIEKDAKTDTNSIVDCINNKSSNFDNSSIMLDATDKCISPQIHFNIKDNSTTLQIQGLHSEKSEHFTLQQISNVEEISHTGYAIAINENVTKNVSVSSENTSDLNVKNYKKSKMKSKCNNKYKHSSLTKNMPNKSSLILKQNTENIQLLRRISDHESQDSMNTDFSDKSSTDSVYSEKYLDKLEKVDKGKCDDLVLLKSSNVNKKNGRIRRKNIFKIRQPEKKDIEHMTLRKRTSKILGSFDKVVKEQNSNISPLYKINHEMNKKEENIVSQELPSIKRNILGNNSNSSIRNDEIFLHVSQSTRINEQNPEVFGIPSESLNASSLLTPHEKRGRRKSRKVCLVSNITAGDENIYSKCSSDNGDSMSISNTSANVSFNSNDVLEFTSDRNIKKRQTRKSIINTSLSHKDFEKKLHSANESIINETDLSNFIGDINRKETISSIITADSEKEDYQIENVSQETSVEDTHLEKTINSSATTQTCKNNSCHKLKSDYLIVSNDFCNFQNKQFNANMEIIHNHISKFDDELPQCHILNKLDLNMSQSLEEHKRFESEGEDHQIMYIESNGILDTKLSPQKSIISLKDKSKYTFSKHSNETNESFENDIPDLKYFVRENYTLRSRSSLGERLSDIETKKSQETSNSSSMNESETRIRSNSVVPKFYYEKTRVIEKFKVGALVWGQIGCHPYWPCLITKEPDSGQFKKQLPLKNNCQRILYHVRFFGDNGRRAWISHYRLMPYHCKDDLSEAYEKMKSQPHSSFELLVFKVKPLNMPKWLAAVQEAEALKTKTVKEKLKFFNELLSKTIVKSNVSQNAVKTNVLTISKRKNIQDKIIQSENTLFSNSESNKKSPKHKKQKIETPKELSNQNSIPESSLESQIVNHNNLETIPLGVTKLDEHYEVASKTSSENATINSDSLESQKRLFKKNNLFRGLSREKVCQHCFEGGEVLKCTSYCNGFYHIDCAMELLNEDIKKKNIGVWSKHRSIQNEHEKNQNSEENKTLEHKPQYEIVSKKEIIDDHVQIITVPSNIYNTPPRKTFPSNFKNMSLAEQIDYKMKEIMRKFESKTTYAESTTDSSSEENSIQLQANNLCFSNPPILQNGIDPPLREKECPKLRYTVHITADSFHDVKQIPKNEMLRNSFKISNKKELKSSDSNKHVISVSSTSMEGHDFKQFSIDKINPKQFKCGFCTANIDPYCFICHEAVSKKGFNFRQKCSLYWCGRFYHPECLKLWPQTQWSLIQMTKPKYSEEAVDSFVCPQHVCHTCASENPRAAMSRCTSDKIVRCLLCPASYHSTNLCIPAGTEILSTTQIICPRHGNNKKSPTINTTWCFLCSQGGNLICCETCPTSVHPECMPVNLTEDDKFICEDCESGRLPLYDEIVWVKLGKYRWWPAVILFPNEVPQNIMNVKHNRGDFVVKFFGTYDYNWVNKGRSFLFQDGDKGCCSNVKKRFDEAFNKAVEEAIVAHKLKKEFKLTQEVESFNSQKPPPYIKIKVNKVVGNAKLLDLDLSNTTPCECDPSQPHPCGPDTDCLNRLLLTECNPEVCPAGERCKNQSFEKREYPPLVPYKTLGKGWGLKSLAPIKKGQFIIEYVGEMIDDEEYQRRIQKMHEQKEENYYFLTIDKDRMIDAGPKGNLARFMNHCCQPNCETQKWTVNGNTRVGLFATEDISAETELTFNYNLECIGKEKKVCRCGAPNCSGFIGVKAKQDTEIRKNKKSNKKKKTVEPSILLPCFICNKKGNLGACNNKICNKTYHLRCLKMTSWPEGNKFVCPWHNCNVCSKRTIRCCVKCINSFCPSHSEGNIRYDNLHGFVCNSHDPTKPPEDQPLKIKRVGRGNKITDESAVTSTTSDDMDNDYEKSSPTPKYQIKRRKTSKRSQFWESDIEDIDVNATVTSTPLRKSPLQDENEVSSASASNFDYETSIKQTMTSKQDKINRKHRLRNIQTYKDTANSPNNKVHIDIEG